MGALSHKKYVWFFFPAIQLYLIEESQIAHVFLVDGGFLCYISPLLWDEIKRVLCISIHFFFSFLLLLPYLHVGSLFSYFWSHYKVFQLAVLWGMSHSGTLSLVCIYAVQTCLLQFNLKQNIILIFECSSFSAVWQSFSFIKRMYAPQMYTTIKFLVATWYVNSTYCNEF